jgi:hypothetical protein
VPPRMQTVPTELHASARSPTTEKDAPGGPPRDGLGAPLRQRQELCLATTDRGKVSSRHHPVAGGPLPMPGAAREAPRPPSCAGLRAPHGYWVGRSPALAVHGLWRPGGATAAIDRWARTAAARPQCTNGGKCKRQLRQRLRYPPAGGHAAAPLLTLPIPSLSCGECVCYAPVFGRALWGRRAGVRAELGGRSGPAANLCPSRGGSGPAGHQRGGGLGPHPCWPAGAAHVEGGGEPCSVGRQTTLHHARIMAASRMGLLSGEGV